MIFKEALGVALRTAREDRNLRLRDVSERAFISYSFLSEVERGKKEIGSENLDSIATAMGMNTYDLIIEAGYTMAEVEAKTTVPDTPESLFPPFNRNDKWLRQYEDLGV